MFFFTVFYRKVPLGSITYQMGSKEKNYGVTFL